MALTLADVPLVKPTTQLCEWIERNIPVRHALPWVAPGALANRALAPRARIEAPTLPMPTELEVSTFLWFSGAQRWAYGVFLADADQTDRIRTAAFGSDDSDASDDSGSGTVSTQDDDPTTTDPSDPSGGVDGQPQKIALHIDSGGSESLDVQVNLLRIVPLSAVEADEDAGITPNNLSLIVVVDDRYYWQGIPCPDFGILPYGSYNPNSSNYAGPSPSSGGGSTGSGGDVLAPEPFGPPTWADVINKLADALGATITFADIPAAYLSPDPSFNLIGSGAAVVLDAVLASVGFRLSAQYDGTFYACGWQEAQAARAADDAAHPERILLAGGDQFTDPPTDSTS